MGDVDRCRLLCSELWAWPRTGAAEVLELSPAVRVRDAERLRRAHMRLQLVAKEVDAGVVDVTFLNSQFARLSLTHGLDVIHAMTAYLWLTEITGRWCGED
ncbi:hypothetical protein OPT61_g5153 [Boeremia exigua]|uniref:Uncharacterized protein n=1 Tax=Boeremia exigua TaxID=749465 RepID=A0ACC2IBG6_9PLEO|nr:hypothetical protein OPT61_g5153 [Boeremia exigua]